MGRGEKNPADLTSKMFLTPTKIINSVFYRKGPIDYLKQDPYEHVFLTVTKDGEQYNQPPTELGVVSVNHCTICQIPEQCLVFLANATRIQPDRACKRTPRHQQPPIPTVRHSDVTGKVMAKETVEPEKSKHEIINLEHGNSGENPLTSRNLNIRYTDKPNLVTDEEYVLAKSAALGKECYTGLISHSHTLNTLIRKVMKILKLLMKLNLIRKVRDENIIVTQQMLEREAWRLTSMSSQKHFSFKELEK